MTTKAITDASFQADVLDSDTPVLVDFWAEWCGPCKMIGPSLEEISDELAGKVVDLQAVREQARALATPATPARLAREGICPFKGLANFEHVDADYFFGRERLVAEFVARLVGSGFLGIVGPSGSGKSSVLRAGLLPALAGGVLPGRYLPCLDGAASQT